MFYQNQNIYLSDNYTIADIGTFPWIARHEWHDIGLKKIQISLDGILKYLNRCCEKRFFFYE